MHVEFVIYLCLKSTVLLTHFDRVAFTWIMWQWYCSAEVLRYHPKLEWVAHVPCLNADLWMWTSQPNGVKGMWL